MYAAALAAPALDVNIIEGDSLIGLKLSTALATSMGSVLNHRPHLGSPDKQTAFYSRFVLL